MKRKWMIAIVLLISACSSVTTSQSEIQTAIAQTEAAKPSPTITVKPAKEVTATAEPTKTATPTATPEIQNIEELRDEFLRVTVEALESLDDIQAVTVARIGGGILEIEIRTVWASKDRQPDVSYLLINAYFATAFKDWAQSDVENLFDGPNPIIRVVSYSSEGSYKYQSMTNWITLMKLANRQITYEEWLIAANAGFD